jgi:hypothetical protein
LWCSSSPQMLVYPGSSHFTTAITIYIVILVDI